MDCWLSLPEIPPRSDHALRAWDPSPVLGYVRAKSGRSEHYRDGNLMPWFVVHSERDVPIHVTLTKGDAAVPIRSIARAEALAHVSHEHVDDFPTYGLLDLTNVLLGIEPLSDALSSVIRAPSVWSVLTGGLRVQLTAHFGRPVANEPGGAAHEMVDTPLGTVPAFWLPLVLRANGQDALVCRFLVTWRRSPLLLSMAYCASKRTIRTM